MAANLGDDQTTLHSVEPVAKAQARGTEQAATGQQPRHLRWVNEVVIKIRGEKVEVTASGKKATIPGDKLFLCTKKIQSEIRQDQIEAWNARGGETRSYRMRMRTSDFFPGEKETHQQQKK